MRRFHKVTKHLVNAPNAVGKIGYTNREALQKEIM